MKQAEKYLSDVIKQAVSDKRAVRITGSGSKSFYGNPCTSTPVDVSFHQGILEYEPSELFITARAGTPIEEIRQELQKHQQYLPFDPPRYQGKGTLGGMLASGLSGPARPYQGAVRDYVLGVKCINGKGEILRFGGQVIKNVAGYDVSRLMCGAMGTLGIILEVSLKVLPEPDIQLTVEKDCDMSEAFRLMQQWQHKSDVLSAMSFHAGQLRIRLCGTRMAVAAAQEKLALNESDDTYWQQLRDHQLDFFTQGSLPMWRIHTRRGHMLEHFSMEHCLMDWGGGQYWLHAEISEDEMQSLATAQGAYATLFDNQYVQRSVFPIKDEHSRRIEKRIKLSFDPEGILNPGILSPDY